MLSLIEPLVTNLARDGRCYSNTFLAFPRWYEYLDVDRNNSTGVCQVVNLKLPADLTLIVMAILDMALYLAGLVAVGFVMELSNMLRAVASQKVYATPRAPLLTHLLDW